MIIIGFVISAVVPCLMIFWGRNLRKNPPDYLVGRLSFRTKRARADEKVWAFSNRLFSHLMTVAGVNVGLVSFVFYIGVLVLAGKSNWMAASLSLLAVQAICLLFVYWITDFLVKKIYKPEKDNDEDKQDAATAENASVMEEDNTGTAGVAGDVNGVSESAVETLKPGHEKCAGSDDGAAVTESDSASETLGMDLVSAAGVAGTGPENAAEPLE